MDGELGIYNKMGGGEKYKNVAVMDGGASKTSKTSKKTKKQDRIERLEKKIETLQKVLDKLKEEK